MKPTATLDGISIVLVNTKTPANIGAVARCMMNMGLSRLILVRPPLDRNNEAVKIAAGAGEILRNADRFETLKQAISDSGLVIGTSRHASRHRKNIHAPRDMAERVLPLLSSNKVAFVFGSEVNGLDNKDIALCHELVAIPSSDAFPSLNLSHAVIVVAYELFIAAQAKHTPAERTLAQAGEIENFYEHLQKTLEHIGFIDKTHPEHMMFSLRQIFGRARLDSRDAGILRGILSQVDSTAKNKR